MAAYEVLLLNTAVPQIQAAQSGDTYVVPRDIAFSAALTLSAGTANGVPYLNGSKVLTSGGALTFDGTDVGIGGAPVTGLPLRLLRTSSGAQIRYQNTAATWDSGVTAAGAYEIFSAANTSIQFGVNSSEQMRLTSKAFMVGYTDDSGFSGQYNAAFAGNVGIGTSSPATRLEAYVGTDVNADNININVLTLTGIDNTGGYYYANQGAGVAFKSGIVAGATRGPEIMGAIYGANSASESVANGQLTFHTRTSGSVTEKMRLDPSGNLGLGVTPSAWGSAYKAIQLYFGGGPFASNAGAIGFTGNCFHNGTNWIYSSSNAATRYELGPDGGNHRWFTAPSGTAGDAISFTQALTLDANRNLLLNGTTAGASAVGTLAIFNGTAPTGSVTDGIILYAEDVSSSSELKVRDEAGNVTTLSPHNFSLIPEGPSEDMAWAYYSEKGGKRINVDMLKLARMVEKLTGEKLVYEA